MARFAFYDLSVSPTSFDFATFLVLADHHRRKVGLDHLHIVIVPAAGTRFWENEPYEASYKEWRLNHLLVPLVELLAITGKVTVARDRDHAASLARDGGVFFPEGYSIRRPVDDAYQWAHIVAARACDEPLPTWRAPDMAQAQVRAWLAARAGGRRVISITLRSASYYPENNADLAAWAAFAQGLDPALWLPVVVCDTEDARGMMPETIGGLTLFPEAALDVRLRAALYEQSWLNLSVATGPMMLMWLNPACRFLVFKLLNLENFRSTPTPLRGMGIEPGGQIIGATMHQRLVWKADRADIIKAEFDAMVARIEAEPDPRERVTEDPYVTARRLRDTARLDPAARIYRHILATQGDPAAAFSLSLIELRRPGRSRALRIARAARWFGEGLARSARRSWRTADEGAEIGAALDRWRLTASAARVWRDVLDRDPHHPLALHGLGLIALKAGKPRDAVDLLRQAIAADPYGAQAFVDLGRALEASGDTAAAQEAWSRAYAYDPSRRPGLKSDMPISQGR